MLVKIRKSQPIRPIKIEMNTQMKLGIGSPDIIDIKQGAEI
jgi:hypothetical protein